MSTTMRVSHTFAGDVDTVFGLLTDPSFVERRFAASGSTDINVTREDLPGGAVRVVSRRRMTVDLPGFAQKFIQPTNTVVQTEEWEAAAGEGPRVCNYRVEVQGVPSRIDGTVTLVPDGAQTQQEIEAQVKVSIPLVGGKLEKFAVDSGKSLLQDEAEFTNKELATH